MPVKLEMVKVHSKLWNESGSQRRNASPFPRWIASAVTPKLDQHKNRPVSKCCFSCALFAYISHCWNSRRAKKTNTKFTFASCSSYLGHVGDEKGQPGAEEQAQEDPQGQAGLQRPPPVPVGQATLTVH